MQVHKSSKTQAAQAPPRVAEALAQPESDTPAISAAYADRFIDEAELLRRLPISRRSAQNWRAAGKLPFIRVAGGRRVLFHWPSVQAALLRSQRGGE
jgi:hypothetical protein